MRLRAEDKEKGSVCALKTKRKNWYALARCRQKERIGMRLRAEDKEKELVCACAPKTKRRDRFAR